MRLISLADMKATLNLSGATFDSILTNILDGYSGLIEKHVNRKLKSEERTKYFSGGSRHYWLPAFPVDSVADLTILEDGITLVLDQDFFIDYETGQIEFNCEVTKRIPHSLKVTYTGGFAVVDESGVDVITVSDQIRTATYLQVSYVFRNRDKLGLMSVDLDKLGSVNLAGMNGLIPEVIRLLDGERRLPTSR